MSTASLLKWVCSVSSCRWWRHCPLTPHPLRSVAEAQETVLTSCRALLTSVPVCGLFLLGTEAVHYRDCVGRTLAQEVAASDPLPPFRASMKVTRHITVITGYKT